MAKKKIDQNEVNEIAILLRGKLDAKAKQRIAEFSSRTGINHYSGTIVMVGASKPGTDQHITFSDAASGQSTGSIWPDWAADLAENAFFGDRDVLIFASGDPVGKNIETVYVVN